MSGSHGVVASMSSFHTCSSNPIITIDSETSGLLVRMSLFVTRILTFDTILCLIIDAELYVSLFDLHLNIYSDKNAYFYIT